jgi:hypothetical protein
MENHPLTIPVSVAEREHTPVLKTRVRQQKTQLSVQPDTPVTDTGVVCARTNMPGDAIVKEPET